MGKRSKRSCVINYLYTLIFWVNTGNVEPREQTCSELHSSTNPLKELSINAKSFNMSTCRRMLEG